MDESSRIVEDRLEQLKRATESVAPSARFNERVMAAVVQRASVDWRVSLWRLGRYGLLASFVAVAVSTFFAVFDSSSTDEVQAVSYGTVELEW